MTRARRAPALSPWGRLAPFAAPAFLAVAVMFGGASREAPIANIIVQVIALCVALGAVWAWRPGRGRPGGLALCLLGLFVVFIGAGLLQLVPLAPEVWRGWPGRETVAAGFEALSAPLPALPVSLAPYDTIAALGGLLAPLAMLALGFALPWSVFAAHVRWGVVLVAVGACAFGLVQAFFGPNGGLYFYESTNAGWPVGFFANVNHQASLMLMALPFLAAAASRVRFGWAIGDRDLGLAVLMVSAALVLTVGVLAAGSGAGYWMFGPVVGLSVLVYRGRALTLRSLIVALVLAAAASAIAVGVYNSTIFDMLGLERPEGLFEDDGRRVIFATTIEAIGAHWPLGSGLGTFEAVYPQFEDPRTVTPTFVNMAHNEYLQTLMEFGAAGAVLLGLAIALWLAATVRVWADGSLHDLRLRRAASVALGVLLVHSVVDYPGRTAAIACLATLCALLMVLPGGKDPHTRGMSSGAQPDAPARRHVEF